MMQAPVIQGRISYADGVRIGLPKQPRRGQAMIDRATGITYIWIDEPGLGDLGFWGALLGAVAGPLLGLFSGGPKPDNAAREMLQQQQGQIASLQQEVGSMSFFDKKTIFVVALIGLAALFAFK